MKMAYKKKRKEAEEIAEEEFLAKVGKNVFFSQSYLGEHMVLALLQH